MVDSGVRPAHDGVIVESKRASGAAKGDFFVLERIGFLPFGAIRIDPRELRGPFFNQLADSQQRFPKCRSRSHQIRFANKPEQARAHGNYVVFLQGVRRSQADEDAAFVADILNHGLTFFQ